MKNVLRRTLLTDGSRRENSAKDSWHLALTALVIVEYAAGPVNLLRVLKMVTVHDLVEIDADETFAYDSAGNATKPDEQHAAGRLFGLLPADLCREVRQLWEEF